MKETSYLTDGRSFTHCGGIAITIVNYLLPSLATRAASVAQFLAGAQLPAPMGDVPLLVQPADAPLQRATCRWKNTFPAGRGRQPHAVPVLGMLRWAWCKTRPAVEAGPHLFHLRGPDELAHQPSHVSGRRPVGRTSEPPRWSFALGTLSITYRLRLGRRAG